MVLIRSKVYGGGVKGGLAVNQFAHHMPTRLLVGPGSLDKLGEDVARIARRVVLVTGRRAARLTGVLERIQEQLQAAKVESVVFDQIEPNPTIETIRDGADFARREKARCAIGIGGGSALDAAKAIALMTVHQEDIRDFFAGLRPTHPPLPIVAVPTTAGTGSEVTQYSVVTDVQAGDKASLAMPELFPRLAVLEPSLTASMPDAVTVDTGLDAVSHAVEALFSTRRSVFSDLYARSALDKAINNLAKARAQPDDLVVREWMQLAATFGGMAIADTATLVPHALSYPVTVRYDLPHGRATALILPAFLERMTEYEPERVAFIGRLLGDQADAPAALRGFIERLGVAPRLGAYGVHDSDFELFCRQAKDKAHLGRTPGEWTEESLAEIYRRSL